jgi:hypothetical protein
MRPTNAGNSNSSRLFSRGPRGLTLNRFVMAIAATKTHPLLLLRAIHAQMPVAADMAEDEVVQLARAAVCLRLEMLDRRCSFGVRRRGEVHRMVAAPAIISVPRPNRFETLPLLLTAEHPRVKILRDMLARHSNALLADGHRKVKSRHEVNS